MKRKNIILFLTIGILAILTLNTYASSANLQITGKDTMEPGSTGTMTLKLISDTDTVGVVSGQIKVNANIEDVQMQGKNGWQATYNKSTGEFNILKAEGAKLEDIADITYSIKSNATEKIDITISNIELTTIEYTTINLSDISKEVVINSQKENQTPTEKPLPPKENQTSTQKPTLPKDNQTSTQKTNEEKENQELIQPLLPEEENQTTTQVPLPEEENQTTTQVPVPEKENQTITPKPLLQTSIIPYLFIAIIGISLVGVILHKKYNTKK